MTITFPQLDQVREILKAGGLPLPTSAMSERTRQSMLNQLEHDPLLSRYVQHLNRVLHGGDNRNLEPWHAVGEQRYAAFLALRGAGRESESIRFDQTWANAYDSMAVLGVASATSILSAVPYLWSSAVEHLVRSSPLPRHVISRGVLPFPFMFWSFETAFTLANAQGLIEAETNWNLVRDNGTGLVLMSDVHNRERGAVLTGADVPYGSVFPDDFDGVERQGVEVLLQRLAFIRSPYVTTRQERLPRPIRRELQRVASPSHPYVEPLVHVVELRRVQHPSANELDESQRATHDWQHHWWVSGHYRAQWHPSTKDHEVIWIGPHVKGPLDKPLLEKVYVVDR